MEKDTMYPTQLTMHGDIGDGICLSVRECGPILNSRDGIEVNIKINRSDYPKDQVLKGLSEVFQKVLQYYE